MIENLEIKKSIDQLDPNFIGFLELLDLIEILLMKSQFLENSKRESYLNCQKQAMIQTSRFSSIQTEMDSIHLKIDLIIQKLRKFHPKTFGSNDIG